MIFRIIVAITLFTLSMQAGFSNICHKTNDVKNKCVNSGKFSVEMILYCCLPGTATVFDPQEVANITPAIAKNLLKETAGGYDVDAVDRLYAEINRRIVRLII